MGTLENNIKKERKGTCVGGIAVSQGRNLFCANMTCEEFVLQDVRQA